MTEAGEQLLLRLNPLLRGLDDILDAVSHGQDERVGTLRINASKGGARWLLRHYTHFRHVPTPLKAFIAVGREATRLAP